MNGLLIGFASFIGLLAVLSLAEFTSVTFLFVIWVALALAESLLLYGTIILTTNALNEMNRGIPPSDGVSIRISIRVFLFVCLLVPMFYTGMRVFTHWFG